MSDQPLTMAELIELMKTTCSTLDHPGIAFGFLDFKHEYGEEAGDLRNFASVSSDYYPELHDWYEGAMEEWCEERRRGATYFQLQAWKKKAAARKKGRPS